MTTNMDTIIAAVMANFIGSKVGIGELQRKLDYIEITPARRTESIPRRFL